MKPPYKNIWNSLYTFNALFYTFIIILFFNISYFSIHTPFFLLFSGITIIVSFYIFLSYFLKTWLEKPQKIFLKDLFIWSFGIRVVGVLYLYYLTMLQSPESFPFEINSVDAIFYHNNAKLLANTFGTGDFFRLLGNLSDNKSDWGFQIYLSIVYYVLGEATIFPRLLNSFFGAWTVIYVYKIAKHTHSEKHGKVASILTMLMPSFWWFGGMHLKETVMIWLIMFYINSLIILVKSGKIQFGRMFFAILALISLFYFRVFLPPFLLAISIIYLLLMFFSSRSNIRNIVVVTLFLIMVIVSANLGINETIDFGSGDSGKFLSENIEFSAKNRSIDINLTKTLPFMFIGAVVTPFPSLLMLEERQLPIIAHFQNEIIRNFLYFFVFLGVLLSLGDKFKERSIVFFSGFGYILVLALTGTAFQDRYQLPALPFLIIVMSSGIIEIRTHQIKWFNIYSILISVAIVWWNLFKINLRGL
jgi:hypothetical protein